MTRRKKRVLWVLLFTLWPFILWIAYHFYDMNTEGYLIDILFFAGLLCIVSLFPIITGKHTIFLMNGIIVVAFLVYGLFIEILLGQVTLIVVLMNTGILKREPYRLPLNMLSFICISILSAEIFYLLGGQHGPLVYEGIQDVYYILGYSIIWFVVSDLFNKMIDVFIYNQKIELLDKGLKWEFLTLLLTLPGGILLYLLYAYQGKSGIILVGIPFILTTITLNMLASYRKANYFLKEAGKIGHELTSCLEVDHIYHTFIKNVVNLLLVDYLYIYKVVDEEHMELIHSYDVDQEEGAPFRFLQPNEGFSGTVWITKKPVLYHSAKEWHTTTTSKIPEQSESVLSLPITYGSSVIGVMTIVSQQKKAFEKIHYRFLKIITNYLGVAIENAKNLKKLKVKSETDGLTQLYNYEYFDKKLKENFKAIDCSKQPTSGDSLSLLLLDLDHFKRINDDYGHEAGNQVLLQVAERLKGFMKDLGILARFGGEEFTILLPQTDLPVAEQLAEDIRKLIGEKPFEVKNHLLKTEDFIEVWVTTSIGVASYPYHCQTPFELISRADQAMYIGAKNKGRNKVAVYEKI